MRLVTFGVGNSLDNFIARPDHSTDWLTWNDEVAAISAEYWKTIDTVVMGRKTYEGAVRAGITSYPGVTNYVFSRTLTPPPNADIEIVGKDAVAFLRHLKERPGRGICVMGGGLLARSFLEADLIDEVAVNVQPVLLGDGIPLFHRMTRQIDLELYECRQLRGGSALLRYRVRR